MRMILLLNSIFKKKKILFTFWLHWEACGILVPPQGIKPAPPAHWKFRVLTTGMPGKSLNSIIFKDRNMLKAKHLFSDPNVHLSHSVQFSSVAQQWYLTFCNPMNLATPGLPVHDRSRVCPNPCASSR